MHHTHTHHEMALHTHYHVNSILSTVYSSCDLWWWQNALHAKHNARLSSWWVVSTLIRCYWSLCCIDVSFISNGTCRTSTCRMVNCCRKTEQCLWVVTHQWLDVWHCSSAVGGKSLYEVQRWLLESSKSKWRHLALVEIGSSWECKLVLHIKCVALLHLPHAGFDETASKIAA